MSNFNKTLCFTIFGFGLVVSHYAVAEIFLFIIGIAWLLTYFIGKRNLTGTKIKVQFVIIFAVILFAWYIYVASSADFNNFMNVLNRIYTGTLTSFFDINSRGSSVLQGVGISSAKLSWVNSVGQLWAYVTELLLVLGFIFILTRREKIFEREYVAILLMDMVLIGSTLIFPDFAISFGVARIYTLVLISAAPLLVVGIYSISGLFFKSKKQTLTILLALLVLIPFLLFQTGAIYEVSHVESYSIPLSKYRFSYYDYLNLAMVEDSDISGVHWLKASDNNGTASIYCDPWTGLFVQGGDGLITYSRQVSIISNATLPSGSIIYLRYYNFYYNQINPDNGINTVNYVNSNLGGANAIYSNGMCQIYSQP